MTTDPYTPDRGTVRYRYVDGDYSCGNRDPHAEFDRFIAKVRADALREAAEQFGPGQITGLFRSPHDYVSIWLKERAVRIEEEA